MNLQSLGYVGVRTASLADWEQYATRLLGMQLVDKTRGGLALRMDDRKQRLIVNADGGEGAGFFGFEVKDAAALEAFAALSTAMASRSPAARRALADERCVADLVVFSDPGGNRLEVFHGPETATAPFQPGRCISGFRTGPLGMGHVVHHHRTARRSRAVLSRHPRLPAQRLFRAADQDPLLPSQPAPPHASASWRPASSASIT